LISTKNILSHSLRGMAFSLYIDFIIKKVKSIFKRMEKIITEIDINLKVIDFTILGMHFTIGLL